MSHIVIPHVYSIVFIYGIANLVSCLFQVSVSFWFSKEASGWCGFSSGCDCTCEVVCLRVLLCLVKA